MKKIKAAAALLVVSTLVLSGWYIGGTLNQYKFNTASKIWVEGTSTLHDFTCEVRDFSGSMLSSSETEVVEGLQNVNVTVPVTEIDCGNGTMDKKMRKALEVDKHPEIEYELQNVRTVQGGSDAQVLATMGSLSIAGTQRVINMEVQGVRLSDGKVRFQGSVPILLSEFGIDRPSAALGTIKTGDEVKVHFDVVAELGR